MEQIKMLREQAKLLRDLAAISSDARGIRQRMLDLAKDCDELADERERVIAQQRGERVIAQQRGASG